tara:strand:+ start:375 stop:917 length:543 start_codon:yes stop_codon:yes gene_type:complete
MKFLIFNIIVLCSLGYLLTSKSNENFNEWLVNTKEKVSQITKEEVISTVKRATSDNKEKSLVNTVKNKYKQQKEKNDEFNQGNNRKNVNLHNDNEKDKNLKLKKIIDQILAEKKANELKNKKIVNVKNKTSKLIEKKIIKNNEEQKDNFSSKFMTNSQRESALADLIIDMELYHLNSFKN